MSDHVERSAGPVEYATPEVYRRGTFPESWGPPEGRAYSKEREAWIPSKIDPALGYYRQLRRHSDRLMAIVRAAELEARR
jgi:hypothetical protein